jgi:hypothetical protein
MIPCGDLNGTSGRRGRTALLTGARCELNGLVVDDLRKCRADAGGGFPVDPEDDPEWAIVGEYLASIFVGAAVDGHF